MPVHSASDGNDAHHDITVRDVVCNVRDAVVSITNQYVKQQGELISTYGNGFFIRNHFIICPASLVLAPFDASLFGRIPSFPNTPVNARYLNQNIRTSRILVAVSNVNGCGKSYSYEADLVGIDGAANIAVLHINQSRQWNVNNPELQGCSREVCSHHHHCHPFLNWGKSRSACPGDTVILIGNIPPPDQIGLSTNPQGALLHDAENAVALGNLADNRYVSYGGSIPGELLLLSNVLTNATHTGLPVLTTHGKVIGMTVRRSVALAEFFMRRPVKALIKAFTNGCVAESDAGFIVPVPDPIGTYYAYNKSWLGLAGIVSTQDDYDTTIGLTNGSRSPVLVNGALTDGPACKEIVGYRILAVAGPNPVPGFFYTLGTPPNNLFPILPNSPLLGIIAPGDIVTHINGCPLGDRKGQVSPALVMWRVRPGETVTLQFKRESDDLEQECVEITVQTQTYQPFMDYPFYAKDHNLDLLPVLI